MNINPPSLVNFYPRSPCGERPPFVMLSSGREYFYPRSPCGERPRCLLFVKDCGNISIHALLAESDRSNVRAPRLGIAFLSTLSLRRATSSCSGSRYSNRYFYPRSPCGERQSKTPALCQAERFLSTLSLRRATVKNASTGLNIFISIHALLAESDEATF